MSDIPIRKLYSLYFADWLLYAADENLLSLGDPFDERISKILSFKQLVEKEVGLLSEERIARLVSPVTRRCRCCCCSLSVAIHRKVCPAPCDS